MLRPNEEIHYCALLDAAGETLITVPLSKTIEAPGGVLEDVKVDIHIDFKTRATGSYAKRDK